MLLEIKDIEGNMTSIVPEFFTYPDGQQYIKLIDFPKNITSVSVYCKLRNFLDVEKLLLVQGILSRIRKIYTKLYISYLLGARSDKDLNGVNYITDVLSSISLCEFDEISILDIHSQDSLIDLSNPILGEVLNISPDIFHQEVLKEIMAPVYLVYPDKGAKERYQIEHENILGTITCSKVRDLETGKLSGFDSIELDCKGNNVLIIDDICDGGGTFVGILDVLKRKNNIGKAKLAITHGIFSKGQEPLKEFSDIFTTDSFHDPSKLIEIFSERSRISMQSDLLNLQFFHFYNEI